MKVQKRTLGLVGLAAVAMTFAILLVAERRSIFGFYDGRAEVACGDEAIGRAKVNRGLERHAVSNYYLSGLASSGSGSHVSKRMTYHRVTSDFVLANLLTGAQVHRFFGKTPCSFRR